MLALRIDFLTGVYHAANPGEPQLPEWPPAPDRVFQALVAAAYGGDHSLSPLRQLEAHSPEIAFGAALPAGQGTNYVPAAYKAKQSRVAKYDPVMVAIRDPVFLIWPDLPHALGRALQAIAADVDYLGRAKTPVAMSVVDTLPDLPEHLVPDIAGDQLLRVPHAGRLDELDASFDAGRRAPVADLRPYRQKQESLPDSPWGELLTLRPARDLTMERAAQIADALRTAALSVAGDQASPLLHGHDGDHAAWTVLPDVGHRYAHGRVLGIGLWLPAAIDPAERDHCALTLAGTSFMTLPQRPPVPLRRHPAHQPIPAGLRRKTWSRPALTWQSVTPVVLDRHPKRGEALQTLLADSVEMAGYPRPLEVIPDQHSPLAGVPVARAFRPRGGGRWTHVALHFDQPVSGPLLIGRERHFGLGLCRPVSQGGTQ